MSAAAAFMLTLLPPPSPAHTRLTPQPNSLVAVHRPTCSWLSDYQKAQQFIRKEQACFETAAQRLAPLRKQLLNELRQHVRAYQQIADPPEADGPYLYSTQFTPHGTQTISRVSIHGQQQQQQQEEVVSDTLTQRDLLELRHFTGLQLQGERGAHCGDADIGCIVWQHALSAVWLSRVYLSCVCTAQVIMAS